MTNNPRVTGYLTSDSLCIPKVSIPEHWCNTAQTEYSSTKHARFVYDSTNVPRHPSFYKSVSTSERHPMIANINLIPSLISSIHASSLLDISYIGCFLSHLLPLMRSNNLRVKSREMVVDCALLCGARFLQFISTSHPVRQGTEEGARHTLASIHVRNCCSNAAHPAVV